MPHSFPFGSYVVSKDGKYYRKVLVELGDLRCTSFGWRDGEYADKDSDGLMKYEQVIGHYTLAEMNAYYTPCTAKEATGEDEKMEMKKGDEYYYVDSTGWVSNDTWYSTSADIFRLKSNNAFKTRDEAEARLKEIME